LLDRVGTLAVKSDYEPPVGIGTDNPFTRELPRRIRRPGRSVKLAGLANTAVTPAVERARGVELAVTRL
jgi:hypothetical protein